jgi:multidrug resistance efflux pump
MVCSIIQDGFRSRIMNRFAWIFGILLLAGTIVGANLAFNGNNHLFGSSKNEPTKSDSTDPQPSLVMALGKIDGEYGVAQLLPMQSGQVVDVAKEGMIVKKGDSLLKLDDEVARRKVDEAKAALDSAQAQLDQAKRLPQQQARKIAQQQAAINAAQQAAEIAELERKAKLRAAEIGVKVDTDLIKATEVSVGRAKELVKAEEEKLAELKLYDPKLDISRAEADLAAKKAQLGQADFALKHCTLVAPSDGTVLRVHVNVGEVFGPTSPRPAIEFLPKGSLIVRAEILQEWAPRVKMGQEVTIVDDTFQGPSWKGRIEFLAPWFTQRRGLVVEPFMYNDVRYMECLVKVLDEGSYPLRVGQRVRVRIQSP